MKHQEIKEIREQLEKMRCIGIKVCSWNKAGDTQIYDIFNISGKQLSLLAKTLKNIQFNGDDIIDFDFYFPEYYEEYFKCDELTEIAIKFFNCMKYLNWEILDRFSSALGWINSEAYTIRIHTTRKYESDRILEKL